MGMFELVILANLQAGGFGSVLRAAKTVRRGNAPHDGAIGTGFPDAPATPQASR